MKRWIFMLLFIICLIPNMHADAKGYVLKEGKQIKVGYAGDEEDAYNYFKVVPKKDGYIEIKVKTSDEEDLTLDICNESKKVVASDIVVPHKDSVLHKIKKGKVYYIRTKGSKGHKHTISYKMNEFGELEYAKEYSYRFTNASFVDQKHCMYLKIKARETGNLSFMCNPNKEVNVRFYNNKKKPLSNSITMKKHCLTGLGIKSNNTYYVGIWNAKETKKGTTSLTDLKYQISHVFTTSNATKGTAKDITYRSAETLLIAGNKTTTWFKIRLSSKRKLNLTFESRLYQNAGKGIKLFICNVNGKALHSDAIVITDQAKASYNKKYKMKYPRKKISTGELPAGTYYIKVISNNKNTSGSYKLNWN